MGAVMNEPNEPRDRRAADERWMRRAVALAARGRGRVEPNPPVGAVIVHHGELVCEGYHEAFGGPHAEVNAMASAGEACRGAALYVTLEPCTGTNKKTPPCCDAVIAAGFARVAIGSRDETQAPCVERLRAAGMEVVCGVLEAECDALIAPFRKLHSRGMPWVIAKWAMTADGKIATRTGDSRWISSEASRELVHAWRNRVDAVLIGVGTAMRDDPLLTCRIPDGRNPRRIILDGNASIALDSRLVRSTKEAPLTVVCLDGAAHEARRRLADAGCEVLAMPGDEKQIDLPPLLKHLGEERLTNVMVEGGSRVLSSFFERQLVDEARIFIAPKLIGGADAPAPLAGTGIALMAHAAQIEDARWRPVGPDMFLTGFLRRPD